MYSDRTIKEGAEDKFALVEFTNYDAMLAAMRLNNTDINGNEIKVFAWTFSRRVVVCQIYGLCWGH